MTRAGREIDEVVVVLARRLLVAGPAVPELETLDDAFGLEELDGAVDGRQRDAVVDRGGAAVQLDHVRVIRGLVEDAGDDPALAGHAQAFGAAGALERAADPAGGSLCVLGRHQRPGVVRLEGSVYGAPRPPSTGASRKVGQAHGRSGLVARMRRPKPLSGALASA